ncbi:MAG: O-antigen ligase family protein [bacterium]
MDSGNTHTTYPPLRSALAQGFLVLGSMVAVFLAGGARQGATGIFFSVAGLVMVGFAPNRIVPWRYWLLCLGILVASALSLLPQAWFPTPEWRLELLKFQAFPSLPWISLAPRETIYWIVLLAGALFIGLFSLGHPVRSGAKIHIALLGLLGCAAYASLAIYAKTTGWEYPFFDKHGWAPPDFGFFPNRNHTAALLVTGSILALGIIREAWSGRRPIVFVLAGASLCVCLDALLFHSMSRGGVVFLTVGTLVWLAALGRTHRSVPLLLSSLILAVALGWIFFISGGQAKDRILDALGVEKTANPGLLAGDLRSKIFLDTLHVIRDHPLTGTGLGTFGYVFPFYMRESIDEAMPIHPESDWLMLAAEAGIPALLFAWVLLVLLLTDIFRLRESGSWPLRWGVVAAALIALIHGFVDVPVHRVELGWWILVLAGLAFGNPIPTHTEKSWSWLAQRLVFGICGVMLLTGGVALIQSQWFNQPPFPPYRGKIAVDQMRQLNAQGRSQEAAILGHGEIGFCPMERGLYRELGYSEIMRHGDPRVADAAFAAERALNPVSAKIPYDQGLLWKNTDAERTALLWGESLKKHARIEQGGGHANLVEYYRSLLSQARPNEALFRALGPFSGLTPDLQIVWMASSPDAGMGDAAKNPDFLKTLNPAQRREFLISWHARGNKAEVEAFLASHPDWEEAAWPVRLRQKLEAKDYEAAIGAVRSRYGIDLSLSMPGDDVLHAPGPPSDLAGRVAYFIAKGNPVTARREVMESAQAQEPEGLRLRCILALQGGHFEEAWTAIESYLQETKRGHLP